MWHHYEALTKVQTENKPYRWQSVYYRTLLTIRDAALRWAYKIRLLHTHREHTHLTEQVSESDRKMYEAIIEVDERGHSEMTTVFIHELNRAAQISGSHAVHNQRV